MPFTASDLASITSPIHNWVLLLLWLHPFILSGVISPLTSSSILGTYRPGEFLFQYPIILPSHTVRGVLKARTLKWSPSLLQWTTFCQTSPYLLHKKRGDTGKYKEDSCHARNTTENHEYFGVFLFIHFSVMYASAYLLKRRRLC